MLSKGLTLIMANHLYERIRCYLPPESLSLWGVVVWTRKV